MLLKKGEKIFAPNTRAYGSVLTRAHTIFVWQQSAKVYRYYFLETALLILHGNEIKPP